MHSQWDPKEHTVHAHVHVHDNMYMYMYMYVYQELIGV